MTDIKITPAVLLGVLLALYGSARAQEPFTDKFEGSTINSFWTILDSTGIGSDSLDTAFVHRGKQSIQLNTGSSGGIEALSLVPGTTGATPIQNVGAYGQEIANTLVTVEAYDRQVDSFVTLPAADCGFGYRTSRFKTTDKGRFLITQIVLHLLKQNPEPPFYKAVEEYFTQNSITSYSSQALRDAALLTWSSVVSRLVMS